MTVKMKIYLKPNYFLFLFTLALLTGCQSRPAIQNPDLDHYHYGKFVNLHEPGMVTATTRANSMKSNI